MHCVHIPPSALPHKCTRGVGVTSASDTTDATARRVCCACVLLPSHTPSWQGEHARLYCSTVSLLQRVERARPHRPQDKSPGLISFYARHWVHTLTHCHFLLSLYECGFYCSACREMGKRRTFRCLLQTGGVGGPKIDLIRNLNAACMVLGGGCNADHCSRQGTAVCVVVNICLG